VKIVITGGAGFVGLNLIKTLLKESVSEITIIDRFDGTSLEEFWQRVGTFPGVELIGSNSRKRVVMENSVTSVAVLEADIRDYSIAEQVCVGKDVVVHLAAQTGIPSSISRPREDMDVNVKGTLNYLDASRVNKVGSFLNASSAAVVGQAKNNELNGRASRPASPYGASKASAEAYCSAYYSCYGLNTLSLRFANLYGKYSLRKGSVVAKFCKDILNGDPMVLNGDGSQTRDFVHVSDVASVICNLIFDRVERSNIPIGYALDIATGQQVSIKALAERIKHYFVGRRDGVVIKLGPSRAGDVQSSSPSSKMLRMVLPDLDMRTIDQGLEDVVDWFFQQNQNRTRSIELIS
jgi:UDP-glucose 4-epimerase